MQADSHARTPLFNNPTGWCLHQAGRQGCGIKTGVVLGWCRVVWKTGARGTWERRDGSAYKCMCSRLVQAAGEQGAGRTVQLRSSVADQCRSSHLQAGGDGRQALPAQRGRRAGERLLGLGRDAEGDERYQSAGARQHRQALQRHA